MEPTNDTGYDSIRLPPSSSPKVVLGCWATLSVTGREDVGGRAGDDRRRELTSGGWELDHVNAAQEGATGLALTEAVEDPAVQGALVPTGGDSDL